MDKDLNVRVSEEQRQLFGHAADHYRKREGIGTYSDWVRRALIRAARQELGEDES